MFFLAKNYQEYKKNRDMEFPRVLKKNRMWKFQGSPKEEVEFPGVIKKNSWNFHWI